MNANELIDTAMELAVADKGLLVMDESNPTCDKRLLRNNAAKQVEPTEGER